MVKFISRPSCGRCPTIKYLLEKLGQAYESVNLDDHPEYEARMIKQFGFTFVPSLEIDGQLHAIQIPYKVIELLK